MFKKILLTLGLLFMVPLVVDAEGMPGARSASNSAGDVFLGGNYIEVGVSKGGSFGTSSAAPAAFKSHATNANGYSVGLIADGDGWDVGNAPTTGDFFLPGSAEERWILAYKIGDTTYNHIHADRNHVGWESPIKVVEVKDISETSNGVLKAKVEGITTENVKIEIIYSFGIDDKYYNTEVTITNLGSNKITDVRFVRSFDPDQDVDVHGDSFYDTYNKVICNPDSTKDGGEDNYAMVVARGSYTLEGFFFVSFDNRAKVSRGVTLDPDSAYLSGLYDKAPVTAETKSTEASLAMTKDSVNGYTLEDDAIAITTALGDLNKDEKAETNFYSSLDPNVLESITKILKAVAASVKTLTDTRIEVETKEGYEYSMDNGEHWQDSGVFENLEPGKEYIVLSRIKATETEAASESEQTSVTTKHSSKDSPDVFETIVTEEEVVIQSDPNYEYSIDNGTTWQDSPVFTGLKPDTEYTIIARYKETSTDMPGKPTAPIVIHTPAKTETALDEATNVSVDIIVEEDAPGVTIHKGLLYESIMDDGDVKEVVDAGHDAKIVFDVKATELAEEDLNEVKDQIGSDEVAFTVDATLKLYEDGVFKKDITTSSKKITFTFRVPKEYVKKGRSFSIVRKHVDEDGNVLYEILKDEDDNDETITVSSDKFSEFTVVYNDLKNPKTGDNVLLYFISLLISSGAILILIRLNNKEA